MRLAYRKVCTAISQLDEASERCLARGMHLVAGLEGLEMRRSDKLYGRGHFIGEVRTGAVGEQAGAARAKVDVRAIT